jgi:uncharacterized protein YdeI (YjbR/CyaY-like superfamily)
VDALIVPADLRSALDAHAGAAAFFEIAAPSYRRNVLRFASKASGNTSQARIWQTVTLPAQGDKVPQM